METMTKINLTNSEDDRFNESWITLLSGQQDVQKQSLYMMQDMTYKHEYDSLMGDIPIYDRKNMELMDWLLQIERVVLLTVKNMN